jgi:hypothetical protein
VVRLYPGEKVHAFGHTRPSQQIAPFRQMLRGDIAAALRIPQRFLDRDVSRANYSSMRADMIDTQRLLAPVREMVGHRTIGALYRIAAPFLSAITGVVIDPNRYRLVPDGQPYVDPLKDIAAAREAIASRLSTYEAEIGARGGDYRQVQQQSLAESVELAKSEISRLVEIQKAVNEANAAAPGLNLNWAQIATIGGAASAPGAYLSAATGSQQVAAQEESTEDAEEPDEDDKEGESMTSEERARVDRMERMIESMAINRQAPSQPPVTVEQRFSMDRDTAQVMGEAISRSIAPPTINVSAPSPTVTVAPAQVRIEQAAQAAPSVVVNVPQQAAPTVNVEAPNVTVENSVIVPARTVIAKPNPDGSVTMSPVEG